MKQASSPCSPVPVASASSGASPAATKTNTTTPTKNNGTVKKENGYIYRDYLGRDKIDGGVGVHIL